MKFIYVCVYDPVAGLTEEPEVHVYTSGSLAKTFVVRRIADFKCMSDWAKLRFKIRVGWSYKNPEDGSVPRLREVRYFGYRRNDNNELVSYIEEVQR